MPSGQRSRRRGYELGCGLSLPLPHIRRLRRRWRSIARLDQGQEPEIPGVEPAEGCLWIYVDTSKQVGDAEHVKVLATTDAVEKWLEENDPEGVAFEYEVLE